MFTNIFLGTKPAFSYNTINSCSKSTNTSYFPFPSDTTLVIYLPFSVTFILTPGIISSLKYSVTSPLIKSLSAFSSCAKAFEKEMITVIINEIYLNMKIIILC